jgi:hypothetical protein
MLLFKLPLYAQSAQRVITIAQSTMDIPKLAKTIATQTGLEYSLNMQNTSVKKNVQLKPGKWKLEDVMKEVQQQVGLNYKIIGDHILFTDYKPAKKIDSVQVVKPKPQKVTRATAPVAAAIVIPEKPYTGYDLSPVRTDHPVALPALHVKSSQVVLPEPTTHVPPQKEKRHIEFPTGLFTPMAAVGFTANDVVYGSASVKAGIQSLYGIGTYGVSSRGLRFRYGAGIRVPLNESNAIHAEFTTGSLSRRTKIPSDSLPGKGTAVERMNSYGLSWSTTIRPRWTLQVEVNYSTLTKKIASDSLTNYILREDGYLGYGTPIYNIKSTTNGRSSEYHAWIGARISLFYNLRRRE